MRSTGSHEKIDPFLRGDLLGPRHVEAYNRDIIAKTAAAVAEGTALAVSPRVGTAILANDNCVCFAAVNRLHRRIRFRHTFKQTRNRRHFLVVITIGVGGTEQGVFPVTAHQ